MTKHSRYERERRATDVQRMKEVQAAWYASLPAATAQAFSREVEAAQAASPRAAARHGPGHAPQSAAAGPGAQAAEGRAALAQVLLMTRKRKVVYPPSRSSKGARRPARRR